MKKLISCLLVMLLSLSLALSVSAAAAPEAEAAPAIGYAAFVEDHAQLLTTEQLRAVSAKLEQVSKKYGAHITVVTLPAVEGESIDTLINDYYDGGGYGYGTDNSGVLLLLSMDPREFRILSNGKANAAIDYDVIMDITDDITPLLSAGDYAGAFTSYAERCSYYLDGEENGLPFNWSKVLLIAMAVGLLVGLIVALVLKGQLKSVRPQPRADVYVRTGSMELTQERDMYLYSTVTRRAKQQNNNRSGGGGSSRSVGGGSF